MDAREEPFFENRLKEETRDALSSEGWPIFSLKFKPMVNSEPKPSINKF
jgi:hypothetical protein